MESHRRVHIRSNHSHYQQQAISGNKRNRRRQQQRAHRLRRHIKRIRAHCKYRSLIRPEVIARIESETVIGMCSIDCPSLRCPHVCHFVCFVCSSNVSSLSRSSTTPSSGLAYNSSGSIVATTGPSPSLPYSGAAISSASHLQQPLSASTIAASSSLTYPKSTPSIWPRFIVHLLFSHSQVFRLHAQP